MRVESTLVVTVRLFSRLVSVKVLVMAAWNRAHYDVRIRMLNQPLLRSGDRSVLVDRPGRRDDESAVRVHE
jgi:hypothetical protein